MSIEQLSRMRAYAYWRWFIAATDAASALWFNRIELIGRRRDVALAAVTVPSIGKRR